MLAARLLTRNIPSQARNTQAVDPQRTRKATRLEPLRRVAGAALMVPIPLLAPPPQPPLPAAAQPPPAPAPPPSGTSGRPALLPLHPVNWVNSVKVRNSLEGCGHRSNAL